VRTRNEIAAELVLKERTHIRVDDNARIFLEKHLERSMKRRNADRVMIAFDKRQDHALVLLERHLDESALDPKPDAIDFLTYEYGWPQLAESTQAQRERLGDAACLAPYSFYLLGWALDDKLQ
jgi:hypothetical protein